MTVLLQVEKVKNCKMLSHQRFSSSFWAFQCTLCTGIHQLTPGLWREIIPAWRFTRRDPKHLRASPGLISDTLPPPPHHGSTSGRQSRLSLLHLPIRQVSWRWNDGTKQESPRYELWDQPGRAPAPPWNWRIWGEITSCIPLTASFLIPSGLPHHTVSFKEPLLPVRQKSLKRVVLNCKSFQPSLKQCTKAGLSLPLKTALCGLSVRISPRRTSRRKESSHWPVAGPWKSQTHVDSHNSFI